MLRGYQYCQLAVAWLTIQFGNFHGCASASPLLPSLEGFESQNVDDWCIFGWTLQSAASSNFACVHHDLDAFECFSGVGSVYCAGNAILGNERGIGFDWKTDPAENILSPQGFEIALKRVLRLSHHGLLTVAPECSLLVFPSSSVHRRSSRQPFGDTSRQCVLASNSIAFTAMFLWVLGIMRGLRCLLESPPNSWLWRLPFVNVGLSAAAHMLGLPLAKHIVTHCAYQTDTPLGMRFQKTFKFVTVGQWAASLAKRCPCGSKENHRPTMKRFVQKNTGKAKHVGQVRCTGVPHALRESGEYPRALGREIVSREQHKS